jgi:hypothetical protein
VISDEGLLRLCRSAEAGVAGAQQAAWGAYLRSVVEWRERDAAWQLARAERVVGAKVAEVAEVFWLSVLVGRATRPFKLTTLLASYNVVLVSNGAHRGNHR